MLVASTHLFGAHGLEHPLQQDPQLLYVVQEDAGLHTHTHNNIIIRSSTQGPQRMTLSVLPSTQATGGLHSPQTNPTHTTTTEYLKAYFSVIAQHFFALHFALESTFAGSTTTSATYFVHISIFTYRFNLYCIVSAMWLLRNQV